MPPGGTVEGPIGRTGDGATVTPKPCDGATPGAPSTTPGLPGPGVQPEEGGALDWDPHGTPTVGCCADHELTAWVATGTAEATEVRSGPRIHPEGRTTAPGVLASMGIEAPDGAPHPGAGAVGVVQLVATVEGWGDGLPHAVAGAGEGEGVGEGLGLPHADDGAEEGAGATGSEGATATVGVGAGATAGVGAVAVARGRELLEELRRVVVRLGVPVIGIIGATVGSETGTTAAGKDGAMGATGATGATGSTGGATLSATARPPVRLPAECCEALPETERKPPLVATFQLKESDSRSPEMDPEPDRSVKFIRMLRTESVKVQC